MSRLTRFILAHQLIVALCWVAVTIVGAATVARATGALSFNFSAPGEEGFETNQTVLRTFGLDINAAPTVLVVHLPAGTTVDTPAARTQLGDALSHVAAALPGARITSYLSSGDRGFVSADGRTTFALITGTPSAPVTSFGPPPTLSAVERAVAGQQVAGAPVQITGLDALASSEGSGGNSSPSLLAETVLGGTGALVVLAFIFGSAIAIVPLIMAGVAILATFLLVWGLTTITDISFIVEFLVSLIGLGVAIDYSLLIIVRWREERAAGFENRVAVERAMATAGHAVIFSGTAVGIGLLAMIVLPVPFLRSLGYGGLLIPFVSVLVAITLLPVVLATIGPRLDWPRLRSEAHISHLWNGWAHLVVRRRWVAAAAAVLVLALLLIPAANLHPGNPVASSLAKSGEAHDGLIALEQSGIGAGPLTPIEVLVKRGDPAALATRLTQVPGVRTVVAPDSRVARDGLALLTVIPTTDANSSAGQHILQRVTSAAHSTGAPTGVGGAAASSADFTAAVYGNFPLMVLVLAVVTFLLLARAFRSLLLPLKAVLLNVLSIGAAWGILSLVWQSGYGSKQLWGIPATGAVTAWVPFMVFAFLFGLSMDYEVFILSRMREAYDRGAETNAAVIEGIGRTGRLVTGAALILFLSFISLSTVPSNDVKVLATGLAAGILLDATVVRALLVPAAVSLLGHWNWWLPHAPARLLRVAPSPRMAERVPSEPGIAK